MPEKPTIDPKSVVLYPLWTFILLAVASIFFDIPLWVIFLALSVVLIYFAVIIIMELFNK